MDYAGFDLVRVPSGFSGFSPDAIERHDIFEL
jgi:hypothetical protein